MKSPTCRKNFTLLAALLMYVLSGLTAARGADVFLPLLKTRTVTFTNVTVTRQSASDIFIMHSRGLGNVKISTIEDENALRALGLMTNAAFGRPGSSTNSPAAVALSVAKEKLQSIKAAGPLLEKIESMRTTPPPQKLLIYAGAIALVSFLFFSFCLKLVCVKAGTNPGGLVWLPFLQLVPMFRAAGMSGWWMLGTLVPLINLVAAILWSFKIAQARGKGALVGIALLLPVTNLLAFLYLAFSGGAASKEDDSPPTRVSAAFAEA